MTDDIIARLRCSYADPPCEQCTFCAARAEIEGLRAAGDVLAAIVGDVVVPYDDESKARTMVTAYDTWREARRER